MSKIDQAVPEIRSFKVKYVCKICRFWKKKLRSDISETASDTDQKNLDLRFFMKMKFHANF